VLLYTVVAVIYSADSAALTNTFSKNCIFFAVSGASYAVQGEIWHAKFHLHWCKELPLWGEKPQKSPQIKSISAAIQQVSCQ